MRRLAKTPATFWIIAADAAIFVIALVLSFFYPQIMDSIALRPSYFIQGKYLWTLITSMFMHANAFHLFANMFSLLFLGSFLERLIGKKRFLWLYFISGIMGGLFYIAFSYLGLGDVSIPAVGASGAIFGIAGMLAVMTPYTKVYILFIPIAIPMWMGVILIMAVLWLLSAVAGLPIGNTAHLGGLIVGLLYASYLWYKYPEKVRAVRNHFR